jgi:RNA polymerase sigma-70 factor (ECF subfamily)
VSGDATETAADTRRAGAPSAVPTAGEVFRRLGGPVHAYLRAAGAPDCDDLLGDVFVAVVRGIARFRGDEAALRRWVFTIAHHRLVDERRRAARRPRLLHAVRDEPASTPAEPFDPALRAALDSLTDDQREVVVLRFVADLPLEAVAELSGRTVGAVKALQHRALRNLADALAGHRAEPAVAT